MQLPPFPVDESTLQLLDDALNPQPLAERSSVSDLLEMMSQLGGSDPRAVAQVHESGVELRDQQYHEHDVIRALVAEVRRLRGAAGPATYRHRVDCAGPRCGMSLQWTDQSPLIEPSEPALTFGWRPDGAGGWICTEHGLPPA